MKRYLLLMALLMGFLSGGFDFPLVRRDRGEGYGSIPDAGKVLDGSSKVW